MSTPFTLSTQAAIQRIRMRDPVIRAYVSTRLGEAEAEAGARDLEPKRSPLHGVPFGLKDEWETMALPTTGGSARHRDRRSESDAPIVEAFREAGAILVGKTNLSDMGLAPEATSYVGGATRNPRALDRTAGGSSGGAAAAVADGMQAFDWGTDIGGSIRLPSAFCGVLGLKLSSETWPLAGLFPRLPESLRWMCGQGPIAQNTDQIRAVLEVAAPALHRPSARHFEATQVLVHEPDRPGEWPSFFEELVPHLSRAWSLPIDLGLRLPSTSTTRAIYSGVWASHLEELLEADPSIGLREGIGAALKSVLLRGRFGDQRFHPLTAELLLLIALGRVTLFRDRRRARDAAQGVKDAFEEAWDRGTVVVAPVSVYPPPKIGRSNRNPDLLSSTMPGNLADATALAVPFGTFRGGLPRSIQLMGPPGSEMELLRLADLLIASRSEERAGAED